MFADLNLMKTTSYNICQVKTFKIFFYKNKLKGAIPFNFNSQPLPGLSLNVCMSKSL